MPSRYDLSRSDLAELLVGEPNYRVDQVWQGLYSDKCELDKITTLSNTLRAHLAQRPEFNAALSAVSELSADDGNTVKWLYELHDGRRIETVLMHYANRSTVCVSSQAGCAMACGFCATGQAGFDRQLTSGEIVEQIVRAQLHALRPTQRAGEPRSVTNIVFMGMGEPLANYDQVWRAVKRIHDDLKIGARHITISTVGIIPGIRRLTAESLPVNLAVSLHAANNALRNELVPINRRYPLDALMNACADYKDAKNRRLSFEWALIHEVNDRLADAEELAALALPLRAHVNVIPLNPTPGYAVQGSSPAAVRRFASHLTELGVNVTIRQTRGTDIDAACGQLASRASASFDSQVATNAVTIAVSPRIMDKISG